MVGLLVLAVLVGLLLAALQPAHRGSWRPGVNTGIDRDRARLFEELNLLEGFEPAAPVKQAAAGTEPCQELDPPAAA